MIAPARLAAYDCLTAVARGGLDLAGALEDVRSRLVDPRDRALATGIATGVLRWRAALDHLIVGFSRRRLDQIDPEIVQILRLSAYQLLHLTRVPAAAVVDDGVNLAGRVKKTSAKGFVNAVLRQVSRQRRALPLPPKPADWTDRAAAIAYLTITLSHPEWLVRRWLDRYGFDDTERWLLFNNAPAPLTLRANRARTSRDALQSALAAAGVQAEPGRFGPDALLIGRGGQGWNVGAPSVPDAADTDASGESASDHRTVTEALARFPGQFVVQDEASQLVALLAGPTPGPRVLDACAAPGGKTTALAAAMAHPSHLVACDVRTRRLQVLRRTLATAGFDAVPIVQADLREPLPFRVQFDCVLVDAPCSGLGTLRRDPDIKWRCQPEDLAAYTRLQRLMLQHAAQVVAPGGRLIYATCSSEPDENEAVAREFAAAGGFHRVDAREAHPALQPALVDEEGALHTSPVRHGLEAFYGAVFERDRGDVAPPPASARP